MKNATVHQKSSVSSEPILSKSVSSEPVSSESVTSKPFSEQAIKNPAFKRIGLIGHKQQSSVISSINEISRQIQELGLRLFIGSDTAKLSGLELGDSGHYEVVERDLLGDICDLVIVVGGDGSMLHAASALARYGVPVLGVNRGRLGFLTDVNPDKVGPKLHQVLMGDYQLDQRFLLMMEIHEPQDDGSIKILHQDMALNDVVLHAGKSVHMIDFHLKIDGLDVYRQHSDGLIVATPTGSTAYALSGGGPIIHPSMDAFCLVPMYPHVLTSRPIVVSGQSEIRIQTNKDNRVQPMVSADGRPSVELEKHHTLVIHKHPDKLTLLHPPGFDFYKACRMKLNWNVSAEDAKSNQDTD